MILKTPKCPTCGSTLHNFTIDSERVQIICVNCQSPLAPAVLIDNSNVDYFANIIPDEHKEQFLKKLGFEKKPIVRTSKFALTILIILLFIVAVITVIIDYNNIPRALLSLLILGCLITTILKYYKAETKPKWRRKKPAV